MSSINEVVSKIVADEEFGKQFFNDPSKAIEGFDLSEAEKAQLVNVDVQELVNLSNELEDRLSKSFINLPTFTENDANKTHSSTHGSHSNDHSNTHKSGHSSW